MNLTLTTTDTGSEYGTAHVRRADADDVAGLVALRVEMFNAMGIDTSDESWRAAAHQWFDSRLDDSECGIFVVEVNGKVVACAVGAIRDAAPSPSCPRGRDVLISNVCTLPAFRGRGLGSAAFDAVLTWARGTGVERAELMATPDGKRIYEQAGFAVNNSLAMRATLGTVQES